MPSLIRFVALFAPIVLNVALWWRFAHRKRDERERTRSEAVVLGVVANTLAVALPWLIVLVRRRYHRSTVPYASRLLRHPRGVLVVPIPSSNLVTR